MDNILQNKPVRGCLGMVGFGIAGICLAATITGLGDMLQQPATQIPSQIGATVCLLVSGAFGGVLCWYGYVGVFGERKLTDHVENQILNIAKAEGGRVTVALVAASSDLSMADSESILTRLAKDGLVRLDIDADGDNVYVFPGLDDSETTFDEAQFEEELAEVRDKQTEETVDGS